jgi:hypothetical protein
VYEKGATEPEQKKILETMKTYERNLDSTSSGHWKQELNDYIMIYK